MPEFIGRPSLGVPSDLWQTAIRLAAQRANPMLEAIKEGMGGLMSVGNVYANQQFQVKQQAAAQEARALEAANAFGREKELAFGKLYGTAAAAGGLEIPQAGESAQAILPFVGTGGMPGVGQQMSPGEQNLFGPAVGTSGAFPNIPPVGAETTQGVGIPSGGVLAAEVAKAMGVQYTGDPKARFAPVDKGAKTLAEKKAFLDYKISKFGFGGSKTDQAANLAEKDVQAWASAQLINTGEFPDDVTLRNKYAEFYAAKKATMGGTYAPGKTPEVKKEEEKPGLIRRGLDAAGKLISGDGKPTMDKEREERLRSLMQSGQKSKR